MKIIYAARPVLGDLSIPAAGSLIDVMVVGGAGSAPTVTVSGGRSVGSGSTTGPHPVSTMSATMPDSFLHSCASLTSQRPLLVRVGSRRAASGERSTVRPMGEMTVAVAGGVGAAIVSTPQRAIVAAVSGAMLSAIRRCQTNTSPTCAAYCCGHGCVQSWIVAV